MTWMPHAAKFGSAGTPSPVKWKTEKQQEPTRGEEKKGMERHPCRKTTDNIVQSYKQTHIKPNMLTLQTIGLWVSAFFIHASNDELWRSITLTLSVDLQRPTAKRRQKFTTPCEDGPAAFSSDDSWSILENSTDDFKRIEYIAANEHTKKKIDCSPLQHLFLQST